jgi:beta-lactamase class A
MRRAAMRFSGKQLGASIFFFVLGSVSLYALQTADEAFNGCPARLDLLNPATVCDNAREQRTEWDYEPLRQTLSDMIEELGASGQVPHVSVFFRDLKNGPRFGIREYENFIPASLLKVPVMIVLLHQADRHAGLLDETLVITKEFPAGTAIADESEKLDLQSAYSVRFLLEKMIMHSDNSATYALLEKINTAGLQQNSNTFSDLGTMKLMNGRIDNTRLISLVNLYVTLYNAAYLSEEMSQYALDLLSRTTFDQGIVAGLPGGIRVAHKYGIHADAEGNHELHDCGIVYHSSTPYVLCVLTAGADVNAESKAIQAISRTVYEAVSQLR